MNFPNDLKYTADHEWIRVEGDIAVLGITDFAQSELGDVVFVELPDAGAAVSADKALGTIEAVKTVSDIVSPVDGEVIEVNENLGDAPESVNDDPYGEGWMVKIRMSNPAQADALMSDEQYKGHIG